MTTIPEQVGIWCGLASEMKFASAGFVFVQPNFQAQTIRRTWHNAEWWFAIVDVVAALTDSIQPEGYVKDLRRRDKELAKGWGQIATPLRIETEGGIQRVNCANTESLFRIIQSIPSPRAEPFKRWRAMRAASWKPRAVSRW